mgnify:CR=1 FL=1
MFHFLTEALKGLRSKINLFLVFNTIQRLLQVHETVITYFNNLLTLLKATSHDCQTTYSAANVIPTQIKFHVCNCRNELLLLRG